MFLDTYHDKKKKVNWEYQIPSQKTMLILRMHLHYFASAHLPLNPAFSNEFEPPHILDGVSYLPSFV